MDRMGCLRLPSGPVAMALLKGSKPWDWSAKVITILDTDMIR